MASHWSPSSPAWAVDCYRPHAALSLDRPPRPGPRQPDCWRPEQTLSSPPARTNRSKRHKKKKALNTDDRVKKQKVKLPKLPNPNKQPLGKRQMGVINSIMKSEKQNVKATKKTDTRDDQLIAPESEPLASEPCTKVEDTDHEWTTGVQRVEPRLSEALEVSRSDHPTPPTYLPLPPPAHSTTHDHEWCRTNLSDLLPLEPAEMVPFDSPKIRLESASQDSAPRLRRKLDFGNRVDQCLLKMDKWADAWLSSALINEDPNTNPDNAWQSFEHCLSMPDVLEEGEIVEYEKVPRRELPIANTELVGLKRKRYEEQSSETLVGGARDSCGENRADGAGESSTLPPIYVIPAKRPLNVSTSTASSSLLAKGTPWTDLRETKPTEFQSSSSPECKRIKVFHIPSAATLREEARRRLMEFDSGEVLA